MSVYLDEEQMGRDPAIIGFPHLLLCMGFVLRTPTGLWGVHLTSASTSYSTVQALRTWARMLHNLDVDTVTHMFGCCQRLRRYGITDAQAAKAAWMKEMASLADVLGYKGRAYGFCTSILPAADGHYVEYQHHPGGYGARLFYGQDTDVRGHRAVNHAVVMRDGTESVAKWNPDGSNFRQAAAHKALPDPNQGDFRGQLFELDYVLRMEQIIL
jgi:hypothetical protein